MARWAVFDIDGTLLPDISMERVFLRYLLREKLLPFGNIASYLLRGLTAALLHGWEEAIKRNKVYLRGLRVSDIDTYAEACFHERIAPAIVKGGKQQIESLMQEGYRIMIISGAPSFLVRPLEPVVRPDVVISTELEVKNGCYTGRIEGPHPFGIAKRAILENMQKDLDLDFSASVVFANHHSDIHHMKLFGRAVAVNATPKLRKLASELGWEMAAWTSTGP
jgi:HAD superfamily hydrolase (TIGR01490 family)